MRQGVSSSLMRLPPGLASASATNPAWKKNCGGLVAVENQGCPWATWTVKTRAGQRRSSRTFCCDCLFTS